MKKLVVSLAITSSALAIISGYLGVQLGSERARSTAARAQQHEQERKLEALQSEREQLARKVQALRRASAREADYAPYASGPRALGLLPASAPASEPPPQGRLHAALGHAPQFTVEQRTLMVRRTHGELLRELQLPPQQLDALLATLVAQHEDGEATFRELTGGGAGPTHDPEKMQAALAGMKQQHTAAIAAVIGPEKAREFAALQETVPARMELKQLRDHLEAVGTPVNEEQRMKLLAIMKEQQQPPPQPGEALRSPDEAFQRFQAWRSENSRRFRERAAAVLSPEQLKEVEAHDAWQASMMSTGIGPGMASTAAENVSVLNTASAGDGE